MSTKFCKNPAAVSSHQQQPVTSHCCCSGPGNDCLLLLASARSINCLSSATTMIITHVDTRRSFATFQPFEFYPHSFCPRPLTHLLPLSFCPIPSPFTGVTFSLNGSQKAFIYFNIWRIKRWSKDWAWSWFIWLWKKDKTKSELRHKKNC